MKQNQKDRSLVFIPVLFTLVFIMMGLLGCSDSPPTTEEPPSSDDATATFDPMVIVQMIATQTAAASRVTPAPGATLAPGAKYWTPPATDQFAPRFTYNSAQWTLKDPSTLANLQIKDCTLSQSLSPRHESGSSWTTEQSLFQAGDFSFLIILTKKQGAPQFITFYAPNGTAFEIASASDFAKCQQAGESVLKSLSLQ